jgi:soluble lytic murein transglycosylase
VLYETLPAYSPDPEFLSEVRYGKARTQFESGDPAGALATLDSIISGYPDLEITLQARYLRGLVYIALNQPLQAAQDFRGYREDPRAILIEHALVAEGDAWNAAGELAQAEALYREALAQAEGQQLLDLRVKFGNVLQAQGKTNEAIEQYQLVYDSTSNDFVKAQMDLLLGRLYLGLGLTEEGYARFQDAVENYPLSYDSYAALVDLVAAGVPVSDLDRGIVDYFAGQYAAALAAFDRYLLAPPEDHTGAVHHYRALTLRALGDYEAAVEEWGVLIETHPVDDAYYAGGWEERVDTLWAYMDQYTTAVDESLAFAQSHPDHLRAAEFIFFGARIAERANLLLEAARSWELVASVYPANELAGKALFLAGVTRFRLGEWSAALADFEAAGEAASDPAQQAAAYLWVGKVRSVLGEQAAAEQSFRAAQLADPGGYYGLRAGEILVGGTPFQTVEAIRFPDDEAMAKAQLETEVWMREAFGIDESIPLRPISTNLEADPRFRQGQAYWALGEYELAKAEFESLRVAHQNDPLSMYQLMLHFIEIGLYQPGIRSAHQLLYLAGLDQVPASVAPAFISYHRFGPYFSDIIFPAAEEAGFDPLFILSVTRQESLFEGFAISYAAARGLMQIIPSTGASLAASEGWPPGYEDDDLYRPVVSVRLGVRYLADQRFLFEGDLFATLAAYNAGPGNALAWDALAAGDPDLFLEVIRLDQPQDYIRSIYWAYRQYQDLYRSP